MTNTPLAPFFVDPRAFSDLGRFGVWRGRNRSHALLPVYGLLNQDSSRRAALLVTFFSLGNVLFQVPLGMLSDRIDRQKMLFIIALIGPFGALIMPLVASSFKLLSGLLLIWSGLIGGCYPIGLAHLGSRFSGVDLASANAPFMFYSLGMLTGPHFLGAAMDLSPPHGVAFATAPLFGLRRPCPVAPGERRPLKFHLKMRPVFLEFARHVAPIFFGS